MTKGGARAGQDARKLVASAQQDRLQLAMNDVQIKFECHQRAVAATSTIEKVGEAEKITPVTPAEQLAYSRELYDWVTEALDDDS